MSDPNPGTTASSPRISFAAGSILQLVGFILALGSCCWWSFAGLIQTPLPSTAPPQTSLQIFRTATSAQLWGMAAICVSFVGGLALAALGMGIGAQRRRSAVAAAIIGTMGTLFWLTILVAAAVTVPSFGGILLALVMLLVWAACALLGWIAADELKRFPPPADLNRAPPDLKIDRAVDREMPADLR